MFEVVELDWDKRGWNAYSDTYFDGYYMEKDCAFEQNEKHRLLQFTGLKDKNGKKIYEGDIVDEGCHGKGIVYFGEGLTGEPCDGAGWYVGWGIKHFGVDPYETNDISGGEGIEVIGNIYENPELLLEEKKEG